MGVGRRMRKGGAAALVFLMALAAAISPRPAKKAVPAKPAGQAEGALSGRVILVDPGHGGTDGGARARESGKWEKEINLLTALALRDTLEEAGARVILTRDKDMQYSKNKREDLTSRLELARENGADMIVSIHMNEYRSRRESGPQVFYRAGQAESRLLAGALQSSLIAALKPQKERVAMAGDYFILSLDVPSVLVECGFLSNPEEEKKLLTAEYRRKIAEAIRDGIIEYLHLSRADGQ